MKSIFQHHIATPLAFAALLSLGAPGLSPAAAADTPPDAAGHETHHPDKADKALDATARSDAQAPGQMTTPDSASSPNMMDGVMKGDMMKGGGMMGRCASPAVVINVFPGGQMSMGEMKPMGMMGAGMSDDGAGMMGMEDMAGMMAGASAAGTKVERKDMSAEDVRNLVQSRLDKLPHGPVKVGDITALDDNLFSAQLLNEMGEKMHRLVINRHTGKMMQAD
jgi:hypothetical protein